MQLEDLFAALSIGPLKNTHIGRDGDGQINQKNQVQVKRALVHVLNRIYLRFPHRVEWVTILLSDAKKTYRIHPTSAVSQSGNIIQDTVEDPFTGPVLKLVTVREPKTSDRDYSIDLTVDRAPDYEMRLSAYDTLYFAEPEAGRTLEVECILGHPEFSSGINHSNEILIHPALEQLLEVGVAAKILADIGSEATLVQASKLESDFNRLALEAETYGVMPILVGTARNRIQDDGWT